MSALSWNPDIADMFLTIVTENQMLDKELAARNVLNWITCHGIPLDVVTRALEEAVDCRVPEMEYEVEDELARLIALGVTRDDPINKPRRRIRV